MARILIIDDDPDIRDFLEHTLNSAGHQTLSAIGGREGLTQFLRNPSDLVITDLFMPELDGLEIIAGLRTRFPELPIIAMTGHTPDLLSVARKMGSNEILPKPFSSDELLAAVQKVLSKPRDRAEPRSS
jgi:two-component system nitrogen regulation response regulator GlnG